MAKRPLFWLSVTLRISPENPVFVEDFVSKESDIATRDKRREMLRQYAVGHISRKTLQESIGMEFGEILSDMAREGLTLPRVDSRALLSDEQKLLFTRLVG